MREEWKCASTEMTTPEWLRSSTRYPPVSSTLPGAWPTLLRIEHSNGHSGWEGGRGEAEGGREEEGDC